VLAPRQFFYWKQLTQKESTEMSKPTMTEKAVDVKNDVVELAGLAAKATEEKAIEATDGLEDLYARGVKKAKAVKTQIVDHLS
jgi:hypothetical protein